MFGPTQRLFRITTLSFYTLFLYFLMRFVFLAWNWAQFKNQIPVDILLGFVNGVRFDISAIAYLMAPIMIPSLFPWPRKWQKQWQVFVFVGYLLIHLIFLTFNYIDIEFINFVGRRMTIDVIFLLKEGSDKVGGFLQTYLWLFVCYTCLVVLQIWLSYKIIFQDFLSFKKNIYWPDLHHSNKKHYAAHAFLAMCFFVCYGIAARGGLQNKPLNLVNANVFTAPILNNLVLNTPFNILKSYNDEPLSKEKYFTNDEELLSFLNGRIAGPSLLEGHRIAGPQNIVIIIMESFGLEYMGEVNGVKGYTPFLDSLARQSLFFKNGIANGRRSIEGVAAVMAGIPALMDEPFITSTYTANYFVGMGSMLTAKSYQTAFFHGGNNGTMYFDSFLKSTGVGQYFGASEYPNIADHDGAWGIYDGPFFQFFNKKISDMKQPFMAGFFSLSSHQPYRIPDNVKNNYKEGSIEILKSISYADDSLRQFFEEAKKQEWFNNTLFVITADHAFRPYLSQFDNELSRYRIPIMFYHPQYQWPALIDRNQVVQQIDIIPSVMDFLGIQQKEFFMLGSSVFSQADKTATTFANGNYMLIAKDYFINWSRSQEPVMYNIQDLGQREPLLEPKERRDQLINKMKASIQYYNRGMWDNRLYYPITRE